jgi:hypothetical protein
MINYNEIIHLRRLIESVDRARGVTPPLRLT